MFFFGFPLFFFGCADDGGLVEVKAARSYMGTEVEITVAGEDGPAAEAAVKAAFDEIGRVEGLLSRYREGSEVWRINAAEGGEPVRVSGELYSVVERGMELSIWSEGAFDVTVGGFRGLWSFDPERPRRPSAEELQSRLPFVGWEKVILQPWRPAVGFLLPGMALDLGGIAKGYAVDQAVLVLRGRGVKGALVNAGGDLYAMGARADRPWQVGIQDPRRPEGIIAVLKVMESAVATSGDYEKFFFRDGRRYSHILVPRTGRPAELCRSVTIVADAAWLADGLATAVFVLGPEKGMEVLGHFPGTRAVIIGAAGERIVSPELTQNLEWLP